MRTGTNQKTSYFENYNSDVNQGIRFNRNLTTTKDSDRITIPYGIDLTNLESKFTSLEDKINGLTIENNGIEFIDPSDSENKIIIPYGITIPEIFSQIQIHSSTLFPNIYLLIQILKVSFQLYPLYLIFLMMEKTHMQEFMF
jgi:hypothetical protein